MALEMKQNYIRVLNYIGSSLPDGAIYDWILKETAARGIPEMQITPAQGRVLNLLAKLIGARRVVEIGALSGYSGAWIATALPPAPEGKLTSLEINEKHAEMARDSFRRAGVADRAEVIVGPALASLEKLEIDGKLDMVFIDADKPNNYNYFQWAIAHVRPGGLILVDNVLANGRVAEAEPTSAYAKAIAEFNRYIFENYNPYATVVPFYKPDEDNLDGLLVVRVPDA
jgi:predicted O-methyltransferase YrrM